MSATTTALVTGASSGLGRALALRLAADGVDVVLGARRVEALSTLRDTIVEAGGHADVEPMDVSRCDDLVQQIAAIDERKNGLDLIVANAGIGPPADAEPYSWRAISGPCHVNFCGAAATLTAVLPQMVQRGRGHLVGICSLASFGALPASASYCAPKAGLSMLLDCLRLDVEQHGVTVTTVNVGFVSTPMVAHRPTSEMPQLLTPEAAATHIVSRLQHKPSDITFPQPLALSVRLFSKMPLALRKRIADRVDKT